METYSNGKHPSLLVQIMTMVDAMTEPEQQQLCMQLRHHHSIKNTGYQQENTTCKLTEEEIAALCKTAILNNGC